MKKNLNLFLLVLLAVCCFQLTVLSQAAGAGGLGKSISGSLGGLVNANIFKNISQSKSKIKTKRPVVKTNKKVLVVNTTPVVTNPSIAKVSKSKKTVKIRSTRPVVKEVEEVAEIEEDTPVDTSVLSFKPITNTGLDVELARTFTTDKTEQNLFLLIFRTTKTAYDAEAAKEGKKDNLAMAMTFFIVTTSVVYHDSPEPSEESIEKVYQALANSMVENGNLESMSDFDKQAINDRLVYISGMVLAGYQLGKQTKDKSVISIYRTLAGVCLQSLMKLDPNKIKIDKNGLNVVG
jgi:hypothetical protein